jgi:hypothetical protein
MFFSLAAFAEEFVFCASADAESARASGAAKINFLNMMKIPLSKSFGEAPAESEDHLCGLCEFLCGKESLT